MTQQPKPPWQTWEKVEPPKDGNTFLVEDADGEIHTCKADMDTKSWVSTCPDPVFWQPRPPGPHEKVCRAEGNPVLTRREEFIKAAMQGLLAGRQNSDDMMSYKIVAAAIGQADATLAAM